jgi:hypothetical protein
MLDVDFLGAVSRERKACSSTNTVENETLDFLSVKILRGLMPRAEVIIDWTDFLSLGGKQSEML